MDRPRPRHSLLNARVMAVLFRTEREMTIKQIVAHLLDVSEDDGYSIMAYASQYYEAAYWLQEHAYIKVVQRNSVMHISTTPERYFRFLDYVCSPLEG